MLEIKDLVVKYEDMEVIKRVNIVVEPGSIVSLVGPNGAGKSTILKTISGLVRVFSGDIRFNGMSLVGLSPKEIVKLGIVQVPEGRRIFPFMSVLANLKLGAYLRNNKKEVQDDLEWVFELFPRLRERVKQMAGSLSGGEQQMLAIGRALMARPRLLLMDEPSLGLAPIVIDSLVEAIKTINTTRGISILLAEQNARVVLELSHKCYVFTIGKVLLEGPPVILKDTMELRKAFLG